MRISRVSLYVLGTLVPFSSRKTYCASGLNNNASNLVSTVITSRGEALQKIATDTGLLASSFSNSSSNNKNKTERRMSNNVIDDEYPGTAVERMLSIRERVKSVPQQDWNGSWEDVRRKLLWAGGLRDLPDSIPGRGYTGHSFNDFNHVDLTAMRDFDNENKGDIEGIALGNPLGDGIRVASLPEAGPGGSWSTCAIGCNKDPPQDVAHVQFKSRIAFKLVWAPMKDNAFDTFVLVDDDGKLLAKGKPSSGKLPIMQERMTNYRIVVGSKYATEANKL
mmetsp:Transcript_25477/g.28117  ORF Transcript_25477/g.28117 Transcript_25477/m.28117 type:complete len:278 (+) Transcript_25477:166-999(+)